MTPSFPIVLPISTSDADLETVGGKGRSLSIMAGAGLDVPDGFYLTTAAYRQFVEVNELGKSILDLAKPEIGKFLTRTNRPLLPQRLLLPARRPQPLRPQRRTEGQRGPSLVASPVVRLARVDGRRRR